MEPLSTNRACWHSHVRGRFVGLNRCSHALSLDSSAGTRARLEPRTKSSFTSTVFDGGVIYPAPKYGQNASSAWSNVLVFRTWGDCSWVLFPEAEMPGQQPEELPHAVILTAKESKINKSMIDNIALSPRVFLNRSCNDCPYSIYGLET